MRKVSQLRKLKVIRDDDDCWMINKYNHTSISNEFLIHKFKPAFIYGITIIHINCKSHRKMTIRCYMG